MTRAALETFSGLVTRKYLDIGFFKLQAFAKIYTETGVSIGSLRAAFNGTRVKPETAKDLQCWAQQVHHVDIDVEAMMSAPPRRQPERPCDRVWTRESPVVDGLFFVRMRDAPEPIGVLIEDGQVWSAGEWVGTLDAFDWFQGPLRPHGAIPDADPS